MKNIADIMKQVQSMQARMGDMQKKLEGLSVVGQSGGGLVKVTMNGKGSVQGIAIDPSLMKDGDREMLEDLLVAAHADDHERTEQALAFFDTLLASYTPTTPTGA